jgi:hypothetical protein
LVLIFTLSTESFGGVLCSSEARLEKIRGRSLQMWDNFIFEISQKEQILSGYCGRKL